MTIEHKDTRGGTRKGAGRKAEDGATGLVVYTLKMTPELKAKCQAAGSAVVRQMLEAAMQASQK